MQDQQEIIKRLYLRDKHPIPRGALKFKPELQSARGEDALVTLTEIEDFIEINEDVFLNLFSEDQIKSKEYDMVFLDIDNVIPSLAWLQLQTVCSRLLENGVDHFTIIKSGSKGYHLYMLMDLMMLSSYRQAVQAWIKSVKIEKLVDMQAIEPHRVTRIPLSINGKSGKLCTVIGNEDNFKSINEDDNPQVDLIFRKNMGLGRILKGFEEEVRREIEQRGVILGAKSKWFKHPSTFPECIKILYEEAMAGTSLGHAERRQLAIFLVHVTGGNVDEVEKVFEKMDDFNTSKTRYQIEYIIRNNHKNNACSTMEAEGLCPYKHEDMSECPFSPSMNRFVRKERTKQEADL